MKTLRVLSIDGGGIRGYLPALLLVELERRAGRPLIDLFDFAAGTSTGGIIAIGLAAGISAAELADFYPRYGSRIFGGDTGQSEWSKRLLGTGRTFEERMLNPANKIGAIAGRDTKWGGNARHQATGLRGVLEEVLGTARLSEARLPLFITSYEANDGIPVVFSTVDAAAEPRYDASLVDIALATSAAPTYLPPHEFTWAGAPHRFVDGGVWANNPAVVAVMGLYPFVVHRGPSESALFLTSLGTGMSSAKPSFTAEASWAHAFVDVSKMATSISGSDVLASRALWDDYARLQVIDDRIAGAMDDPSPARLGALRGAAETLIQTESDELDRIVARLTQ